jgi:hypothetical protein
MTQMACLEVNTSVFLLRDRPKNRDFTPAGQAFPYRLLPMKQWQRVWSLPSTFAHGAPPCGGGARISGFRMQLFSQKWEIGLQMVVC